MKYVFQFWSCTPHLEASIEIALNEALSGNDVMYFWGGDDVLFSENNGQGEIWSDFLKSKASFQSYEVGQREIWGCFWF